MTYNPGQQQHYRQVENNISSITRDRQARAHTVLRFSTALFNNLLKNDVVERSKSLDKITKLVKDWAKECYLPEPVEGSTAGTVGKGSVSNTSSPTSNVSVTPTSSQRSSESGDNNPLSSALSSPLFTDGSASASASSYAASPVVDSG